MGDSRQSVTRADEAGGVDFRAAAERRGVLREASARIVIAPDSEIFPYTEDAAEAKVLRILRNLKLSLGPDVADAAVEGIVRAITVHIGGGKAAFDLFTRAADSALVPALKTTSSS